MAGLDGEPCNATDHDEAQLLVRARAGDKRALGRLLLPNFDELAAHVTHQLPRSLQGVIDVDDLVQQTFIAAIRKIDQFEAQPQGSWLGWLKKIAENQVRDVMRSLQRQKRGGGRTRGESPRVGDHSSAMNLVNLLSDHGETPSRNLNREEAERAIRVGVATLAADQQQAIQLHYIEGHTVGSTADAMQRSPGAVRGLLQRARQSLRQTLGNSSRWFK